MSFFDKIKDATHMSAVLNDSSIQKLINEILVVSIQWLKWFCKAEARLEQTPYPFQPH